jgi:putative peptidoglycan lipid II flippase
MNKLFSLSFLFFIPIISIFLLQGDQVVRLFLERGNFDSLSTKTTNEVLFYLSLSLIFYVIYSFLNKFLYSLQKTNFLLLLTVSVLIIKFGMNYFLVENFKQNGLAISTSLSYLIFFIFAFIKVRSELKLKFNNKIFNSLLFYLFNAVFSFIVTSVIILIIQQNGIFFDLFSIIIFLVIYYFNNQLFGDENQIMILNQLKISK